VYTCGSILAPHVDRDPLVSSAIINVDERGLLELWSLEVYDHEGMAHNLTLEPGEMILYESHSVLHGKTCLSFLFVVFFVSYVNSDNLDSVFKGGLLLFEEWRRRRRHSA
jgi:hypothetical protein